MKLWLIDDRVPHESVGLLLEAARVRGIETEHVHAQVFDESVERHAAPGDAMYRLGTTLAAEHVERLLWRPGVATFHRRTAGHLWGATDQRAVLRAAGVPTPPWVLCTNRNRAQLRRHVEMLGGLPVVVRAAAGEGGVGVLYAESWPTLHGLVDLLVSQGGSPALVAFVPDALHWRVVIVGETVAAAYRNRPQPADFRSYASDDPDDYTAACPDDVADAARRAVAAVELEFGGVDVLVDPHGRCWVLEVNFPCYYPQAEQVAGIPVAQAMVDHLIGKAAALG